jgi:excinuclease ABC subunit A
MNRKKREEAELLQATQRTAVAERRARGEVAWLSVQGAAHNNLKNIDVHFPLGRFICVTGVSGSGKSSLVNDILFARLARDLNGAENFEPGAHGGIRGLEHLDKVIDIDQSPIGRTPRSNPATYIKVFDEIRALYAETPDAKVRGYKPGRFSFNVHTGQKGGGRCEACEGNGSNRMEMDFLADVWVTCPVCNGHRFSRETLQILFKGKSIANVLEMDVQQALEHFANIPHIAHMLQTLHDVGLDYMKLGQSSTTLSGGEAQRIKLARELVRRSTGRTLYLLDEPTTGLHFADIKRLLAVLHGFVDAGNTVVVIEHNLDVIKTADWVIDLGPEGGAEGGWIVAEGAPEDIVKIAASHTGHALKAALNGHPQSIVTTAVKKLSRAAQRLANRQGRITHVSVHNARQHNLKDVTVRFPREAMTVCSGPSGSGKSSFAIDTVYAEGQRRYVESLSAYARQFLGQMQKPRVERVEGLSPAISIEQKAPSRSPRSTVGTVTEIYDYMRVLWARVGVAHCPACHAAVGTQTSDEIIDRVLGLGEGTKAHILAPVRRSGNETWAALIEREKQNSFLRARIDGVMCELDAAPALDSRSRHDVELVVDRVVVKKASRSRLADSIEQALAVGAGVIIVQVLGSADHPVYKKDTDLRFSQLFSCAQCGTSYEELTPHHLSFNTRLGWCESCEGLGVQRGASPAAIVTHPTRGVLDGALEGWGEVPRKSLLGRLVAAVADRIGFDVNTPWHRLTEGQRLAFLQGGDEEWIEIPGPERLRVRWRGFFPAIDRATRVSWQFRKRLEELVTDVPCEGCQGSRLRPEARAVQLAGRTLPEACGLPLREALAFFKGLRLDARQRKVAGELLQEVVSRLTFLVDVGLEYLSLGRSAPTLSGGEAQRIRLASQIGSGLTGVLYVLDEPTIGLHPRDNGRLLAALHKLRDLGNTLLIVEHDRDVIAGADHVLDFGPGAGSFGGEVTAAAAPEKLKSSRGSLTGRYLSGKKSIPIPSNRRPVAPDGANPEPQRWLTVHRAFHNNLKEVDAAFPLGRFICVTGVSGSGKSSLVSDVLYNALAARIHRARLVAGGHGRISGLEHVDKVINVDQSPIGNSPASNPATYSGLFDHVRALFARLPESKVRGYNANRYSFNRAGGRCEACEGNGQRCIEMHFLPDVWVQCESCKGRRYTPDTLAIQYKGRSIADVLDMRIAEALELFHNVPRLRRMLQTLDDVGLGYLQLGQSAPTLSGGEAQRLKLAAELGRPATGKTVYILDEPTTGLHFDDLRKLVGVLHRLVDLGNTVICIEHNLDVIKNADWLMELGPEAGEGGGTIVAECTPEELAKSPVAHTGKALAPILAAGPYEVRKVFSAEEQAQLEGELEARVTLDLKDAAARMPWEVDGPAWHLTSQLDHDGQRTKWSPAVLEWVIATTVSLGDFAPPDWNNPARVELKVARSKMPWFLHALTKGTWLLDISLRVPSGTLPMVGLAQQIGLKTLDERGDLPIYGREDRAQVRRVDDQWDNVRILLHDEEDLKKPAFRAMLKEAAAAYFKKIAELDEEPSAAEPWKTDGRNWHLSQGHLRKRRKRAKWAPAALLALLGRINKLRPMLVADWANNVGIKLLLEGQQVGLLVTNMPQGLRLHVRVPSASLTPVQIDKLGQQPGIKSCSEYDVVTFWLRTADDPDAGQLAALLGAAQMYAAARKARSA